MEQVEVCENRITVRELTLDDRDSALLLSEFPSEQREEATRTALRLGFLMYRQARIAVNVDFVRREFDHVVAEIKKYWKEEVLSKIGELVTDYFDKDKGRIPQKLIEYFGDGNQIGKVGELFNEKNTTSVTYKLRHIIQEELTGEHSAFIKALDPEDENTPIGRLKRKIEGPINDLRKDLIKKQAAKGMAETGTQKGGQFEDLIFNYVDRITAAFGDRAEDVSNQNVAEDYVVTLDSEAVPGQSLRLR